MLIYERRAKSFIQKVISKEDVDKNQVILECENTALARIEVGKVYHDTKKDQYSTFINFHDIKNKVPRHLYEEVWEDNSNYLFEQQIYSIEFFKFVHEILKESLTLLPSLQKEESIIMAKSITRISIKMIFEVLSHAYFNTDIKEFTIYLIQLFKINDAAAYEFLNYILEDKLENILFLLLKCPDKDVRISLSKLLTEIFIVMFPKEEMDINAYEMKEKNYRKEIKFTTQLGVLLQKMVSAVSDDLAQNWYRFEQFFEFFLNILTKCGEKLALCLNNKRFIAVLIDFYLELKSPLYEKGEKRIIMGNNFKKPKFEPLISLVSNLAFYSDMTFIQPNYEKIRSVMKLPNILFKLGKEEQLCLSCYEFLEKTITEGYITTAFSDLICVYCYEQLQLTKKIAKIILHAINEFGNQNTTPCFILIKKLLTLNDSLQKQRLEWLLGYSVLHKSLTQITATTKSYEQIKFGLSLVKSSKEKAHDYISELTYNNNNEALLNILWKQSKVYDLEGIKCLLSAMMESDIVFDYVNQQAPPAYQYASYIDWIKVHVSNYSKATNLFNGFGQGLNKESEMSVYKEIAKLIEAYDKKCQEGRENIINKNIIPYVIGKPVDEKTLFEETKNGATILITEITTEVFKSLPNGKDNLGIPAKYFDFSKTQDNKVDEAKGNIK